MYGRLGNSADFQQEHFNGDATEMATAANYSFRSQTAASNGGQWIIDELGADGESYAKWTIINPVLNGVKFSPIDYSDEGLATVEVEAWYENFTYLRVGE